MDTQPALVSRWIWIIAAAQFLLLLATSTRYGYHGDEMYFITAGGHPAVGYPDQPALVPLLAWLLNAIAPRSLLVLRFPSDIIAAAVTLIAAAMARQLGGGRRAQIIAASCTAVSGFSLAASHLLSTTTFDMFSTALTCYLLVRAFVRHSGPALLIAGLAVGIGSEAKPQVLFVAIAALIAMAFVGPRWPFRSWWLVGAVAVTTILAAPYLLWQSVHGWPQLTVASHIAGTAEGGRAGFVPFQLVLVAIWLTPVWIVGLIAPFRRSDLKIARFIPIVYSLLAIAYLIGNGKAYYLASLYPALLSIGAIPTAEWTLRARSRTRTSALNIGIAFAALVNSLIALPFIPATSLQGSVTMALNPDLGQTVGWPAFIDTVSNAWRSLPIAQRQHTVIFTSSYSEAGAVDVLGSARGLPHAYSGHNSFSHWGQPNASATEALLIGYDNQQDASPHFIDCSTMATIDNHVGLKNNEQGLPVMLCRPSQIWSELWPQLRHYD